MTEERRAEIAGEAVTEAQKIVGSYREHGELVRLRKDITDAILTHKKQRELRLIKDCEELTDELAEARAELSRLTAALTAREEAGREVGRRIQIDKFIAELQEIRRQFGNTCVYVRPGGCTWGAVALNYQADDERALAARPTPAGRSDAQEISAALVALAPDGTCKKCLRFECVCPTPASGEGK
jgi:hypothetical protein